MILNILAKKIEKCIDLPLNISQLVNRLTIMYLMDIYPKKLNNEEVDELFYATLDLVNKMYNMSTTSNNSIEKTLKNKDIIQEKLNKLLETI